MLRREAIGVEVDDAEGRAGEGGDVVGIVWSPFPLMTMVEGDALGVVGEGVW